MKKITLVFMIKGYSDFSFDVSSITSNKFPGVII